MAEQGYRDIFYSAQDGLKLHARLYGEENSGFPVVCLPGLTRNARDFHALALQLLQDRKQPRKVIAFDYRGRGRSAYDPDWRRYDIAVEAGDIMAGLVAVGIEQGVFIGTSRGGLIILALAALRPALLKAVVLNDIGPVIESAGLADILSYLERTPKPASLSEAVDIQNAVHGEAFSALGREDWERFAAAIYRQENGRLTADFDPALLEPMKKIDLSRPLPALWHQFLGLAKIPLLVIRGANSRLLSEETLDEMAARHKAMQAITVPGQGHAPLLETGDLPRRIAGFMNGVEEEAR